MTDTYAYIGGMLIGKNKLTSISPKKTIEGAVGGLLGGGLSFILFGYIINTFFSQFLNGMSISYPLIFLLGILVSVVSQIGDLVASSIKRQHEIKDFGNLFPGHGGMLDRCDSIILVAPMVFLFLYQV